MKYSFRDKLGRSPVTESGRVSWLYSLQHCLEVAKTWDATEILVFNKWGKHVDTMTMPEAEAEAKDQAHIAKAARR